MEYPTQVWAPVWRHRNRSAILRLKGIQRRGIKIIKRVKDYCYRERLEKLGLTILLEKRDEKCHK